ncbi:MAG: hypothetical protein P1U42_08970 [Phycisphaerales bacterium]|nr:hypothetical protein [Phycisphaerales bacterium]
MNSNQPDSSRQLNPIHQRMRTLLCGFILIAGIQQSLHAQKSSDSTINPVANPSAVILESKPFRIDALDLNIFLPEGSITQTTSFSTNSTMGIGFPGQIGVMMIKEQKTSDPDLTITQVAENIIGQLTMFSRSKTGEVLSRNRNLEINTWIGERFYVRIPGANNKPDVVRGMTIFQVQPRKFIIFDLTTTYDDFERSRELYETSVGSIDLGNPTESDVRRAAAIKSTLAFLDLRSVEDYQSAMTGKKDHWERLYLPAVTGDEMDATEYGYRKIKSWGGFKGELSDKPRRSWNEDDRSLGYFVQIDAMAIEDDFRVDTRATFYMAENTKEESWTIKMSLRSDDFQQTSTITGARSDKSMVILLDQSDAPPSKTHPVIQGEGYLSQAQSYLFSTMLAQHAEPGEYASYVYNSSLGTISLRTDEVEKPEDTPDLITVTTKTSNDSPPTVSYYDKDGKLLRVRLANKRIWEPIELERLINLWQKKGLPLE